MAMTYLDHNVQAVREAIAAACAAHGRDPAAVTLVAAIKSGEVEEVNYLHRVLGVSCVGENRVQQLLARYDALDREGMTIHFIGTLQTNKVKYIIDKVDMIQSLDSSKLAAEIQKQAAKVGRCMDVLIEINAGAEEAKSGMTPDEVADFARAVCDGHLPNLRLRGFMTMAPRCETDTEYRRYFSETRTLCERIWQGLGRNPTDMILSMGMSESYLPAVAEGATMVRVGRGLFAGRPTDITNESK